MSGSLRNVSAYLNHIFAAELVRKYPGLVKFDSHVPPAALDLQFGPAPERKAGAP